MTGSIMRGIGSFYTVLCDEDGQEYTLRAQKKLRHQKMTPMVGDRVRFSPGQGEENGWLEEILPRKSVIERPSVANADMLMLVVASVPQPDMMLIDKLILCAAKGGMTPALCVNKIDLGGDLAEEIRAEYAGTQLRVFAASALTGEGVETLREAMRGKVTCLAGQSAVGKSSLLNALFGLELETGGLSRKTDRGRHTTRRSEMMAVDGMLVLDTPGFSLLELESMEPQDFAELYPEYNALAGACRFQPCLHDREPGCAVHAAVDAGGLSAVRWMRYRELLAEVRENWKGRYI
ncbi:MAG: ribosome small subunit-dependent GTPase A [Clostridia bacterium]|nr:ribosome small subunit-dependent GTPase A [Clostridia bacterium]MBQ6859177.1 ribosome small subunit-dependent GTPase A [Clostridia bacterium]